MFMIWKIQQMVEHMGFQDCLIQEWENEHQENLKNFSQDVNKDDIEQHLLPSNWKN